MVRMMRSSLFHPVAQINLRRVRQIFAFPYPWGPLARLWWCRSKARRFRVYLDPATAVSFPWNAPRSSYLPPFAGKIWKLVGLLRRNT